LTVLLEVNSIRAGYDSKEVLRNLTLNVQSGEIVSVVGHNGAGKSTLASTIIGTLKVKSGTIMFKGVDVTNFSPGAKVQQGMCLVPQGIGVFKDLSVIENLRVVAYLQKKKKDECENLTSEALSFFPALKGRMSQVAGSLSGGERQMLSVAMSLVTKSDLIILDEPTLGLSPLAAEELLHRITEISCSTGRTVLLMEENIYKALSIANRIYIIKTGEIVLEETASKLSTRSEYWDLF
jgi:branched-chain amino acid transport system ATP-binding protein